MLAFGAAGSVYMRGRHEAPQVGPRDAVLPDSLGSMDLGSSLHHRGYLGVPEEGGG